MTSFDISSGVQIPPILLLPSASVIVPRTDQQCMTTSCRSPIIGGFRCFLVIVVGAIDQLAANAEQAGFGKLRFETVFEITKEIEGVSRTFPVFLMVAQKG